jgi:EmrB/QacA subfamily drug resistance transporter
VDGTGGAAEAVSAAFPRWRVFPALALGTLMATLDISVVNIALPTLARTFHAPLTTIEWVVLAYVVTITGLLLSFGRLADMLGRRMVYGIGIAVFTASSALCAAAHSATWLIAARAIQGVGAAMMTANSAALLVSNFPPAERGRALGGFGAMVGVGLALGPPVGGLLVGHLSWRWIFLINLPLGLLAQWQLRARVPADRPASAGARLDAVGTLLWFGALVLLMLALSLGPGWAWSAARVGPLFAGAALCFALFLASERRSGAPVLPLRLLRGPLLIAAVLTFLGQSLSIAVGIQMPLYFEEVLGFTATRSGAWLAVLPLAALLFAPIAGRWADHAGPRLPSAAGLAIAAVGLGLLSGLGVGPHPGHILGGMVLIGTGLGLFSVPNSSALLSAAPHEALGFASGLQGTMRNLGISGGAAATAAIVASRFTAHGGGSLAIGHTAPPGRLAFALATRDAYLAMAGVALIAAALAALRGGEPARGPRR